MKCQMGGTLSSHRWMGKRSSLLPEWGLERGEMERWRFIHRGEGFFSFGRVHPQHSHHTDCYSPICLLFGLHQIRGELPVCSSSDPVLQGPPCRRAGRFFTLLFQLPFSRTAALVEMLSRNLPLAKNETVIKTSLRKFHLPLCTSKHLLQKRARKSLCFLKIYVQIPNQPCQGCWGFGCYFPELVMLWTAFTHTDGLSVKFAPLLPQ